MTANKKIEKGEMLTTRQAAKELNISTMQLNRRRKAGKISRHRSNRQSLFQCDEIRKFVAKK